MILRDLHTHNTASTDGIISIGPSDCGIIDPARFYSAGIHPWRADEVTGRDWELMGEVLSRPNVLMVGECGLDALCKVDKEVQERVLRRQIELSEEIKKPLILHIVKRYPDIIAIKKEFCPVQPWIIHGFRGKPQLASELIRHGFYLSLGEKYNAQSLEAIPREKLLVETDESGADIREIERRVGNHLSIRELIGDIGTKPSFGTSNRTFQ